MGRMLNIGLGIIGVLVFTVPLLLDQLTIVSFDAYTLGASAMGGLAAVYTAVETSGRSHGER